MKINVSNDALAEENCDRSSEHVTYEMPSQFSLTET